MKDHVMKVLQEVRELELDDIEKAAVLRLLLTPPAIADSSDSIAGPQQTGDQLVDRGTKLEASVPGGHLRRVAEHLRVAQDRVEETLYLSEGKVQILVPRGRLGASRAERQRNITILAVGALEVQSEDGWVSIGEIRDIMQDAGEYDRNMSENIRKASDDLRVRGSGADIHLRLTALGRAAALDLMSPADME